MASRYWICLVRGLALLGLGGGLTLGVGGLALADEEPAVDVGPAEDRFPLADVRETARNDWRDPGLVRVLWDGTAVLYERRAEVLILRRADGSREVRTPIPEGFEPEGIFSRGGSAVVPDGDGYALLYSGRGGGVMRLPLIGEEAKPAFWYGFDGWGEPSVGVSGLVYVERGDGGAGSVVLVLTRRGFVRCLSLGGEELWWTAVPGPAGHLKGLADEGGVDGAGCDRAAFGTVVDGRGHLRLVMPRQTGVDEVEGFTPIVARSPFDESGVVPLIGVGSSGCAALACDAGGADGVFVIRAYAVTEGAELRYHVQRVEVDGGAVRWVVDVPREAHTFGLEMALDPTERFVLFSNWRDGVLVIDVERGRLMYEFDGLLQDVGWDVVGEGAALWITTREREIRVVL